MSATGPQTLNAQPHDDSSVAPADAPVNAAAPVARRRPIPMLLLAVALFVIAGVVWSIFGRNSNFAYEPFNSRVYICSVTLKTFEHQLQPGEIEPILSPFSGKNTGFLAEPCYWTKSGKQKKIPTYVLLNEHVGKTEKTICPDCGREVVGHNPRPPENISFE